MSCLLIFAATKGYPKEIRDAFVYVGWPLDDNIILTLPTKMDPKSMISIGPDAKTDVEYCPEDSSFFCFISASYSFSVPKHWQPGQTSWEYRGQRFEVIQDGRTVQFFGCSTSDVVLIRASPKPVPKTGLWEDAFFYYSRTHGLLGFGLIPSLAKKKLPPDETSVGGWWLVNTLGFGATIAEEEAWPDCRRP